MKYVVDINGVRQDVEVEGLTASTAGISAEATLAPATATPVRILRIGDQVVRVMTRRGETKGMYTLDIDGHTYTAEAIDERTRAIRDMTAKSAAAAGPAPLKAPMPGLIVRINVAPGDQVQTGQGLVVMEAMKMENELRASANGIVKAIHVTVGAAVEKGTLLIELAEPAPR
ncbi:MAG TPA: biotin/lipoyl-containing protein [Gemmatimonadaceae bacterium]|jgi:biotin carboxyl carrier protein|nr:biotin/lipoyl-containing protein [Gemmatimonadaceae bacterium]